MSLTGDLLIDVTIAAIFVWIGVVMFRRGRNLIGYLLLVAALGVLFVMVQQIGTFDRTQQERQLARYKVCTDVRTIYGGTTTVIVPAASVCPTVVGGSASP